MPWKPVDPLRHERERHRRRAMELARPKAHNQPYKGAVWRALRLRKLAADPICELCAATIATEVDHINADPWDNRWENLRSACKPCHSARTMRDLNVRRWAAGADTPVGPRPGSSAAVEDGDRPTMRESRR
jgi:5-methylcytosine-specific restriction endonuclease McrA